MKLKSIGLVGISGVGRTTFVHDLAKDVKVEHFTASDLIKSEIEARYDGSRTSEQLRKVTCPLKNGPF